MRDNTQSLPAMKRQSSLWSRVWKRLCGPARREPRFQMEGLEARVVMSAGPVLTGVELLGQLNSVNAVVLSFNEALNPATTGNLATYAFGRPPVQDSGGGGNGITLGDILGFRETGHLRPGEVKPDAAKVRLTKYGKIIFSSAVYNDLNHTVTLTPLAPFKAPIWFRYLRIKGTGSEALQDDSGNLLNGGHNTAVRWFVYQRNVVHFIDPSHNRVTFRLTGPGKIVVFRQFGKTSALSIFITGATSATQLTGTVTNPHVAAPVVNVAQLEGAENATNNLVGNPSFNIVVRTP